MPALFGLVCCVCARANCYDIVNNTQWPQTVRFHYSAPINNGPVTVPIAPHSQYHDCFSAPGYSATVMVDPGPYKIFHDGKPWNAPIVFGNGPTVSPPGAYLLNPLPPPPKPTPPKPAPPMAAPQQSSGYLDFHFGMTPAQANDVLGPHKLTNVVWQSMPVAHEYAQPEVRYFVVPLASVPNLPDISVINGCVSGNSYMTFLFANNQLFRISLRLLNSADCSDYSKALSYFAASQHLVVGNGKPAFRTSGPNGVFAGETDPNVAYIEFATADGPRYPGQDW